MRGWIILGLFVVLTLTTFNCIAQEFTHVTTSGNTVSSKSTIDVPGLAGNPNAIIVATPIGDTAKLNPHPIGAWYYNNKWNIFNSNHAVMPVGMKYNLRIFSQPGPNQFLHVVTKSTIGNEGSYIDEPTLNNNPNAQVLILQNHAPEVRAYNLNKFDARILYSPSARKWFIKTEGDQPLSINTAYNVVVMAGGLAVSTKVPPTTSVIPAPVPSPSSSSATKKPTPAALITPAPLPENPEPIAQSFDNLNEFATKGLPAPVALPDGTVDQVAALMAQQILKSDNQSLPVLLTALQAAGFSVRDEKGRTLLRPADGKGQGLVFFDFEAVGSIKLASAGGGVSLEKLASSMTKDVPQLTAVEFADLMLSDLRSQADSNNAYVRFMAQLIIQLSNVPGQPNGLLNAPASRVVLSPLQASLMIRRLQGDLFVVRSNLGQTGVNGMRFGVRDAVVSAFWETGRPFRFASYSKATEGWCNMTADAALLADAGAIVLTTAHGGMLTFLSRAFKTGAFEKLGSRIGYANIVLAWAKLIASVKALKGEITVEKPLPLKRTLNSVPGEKRLMTARIWNEVGKKDAINCFRNLINATTGLDFDLPQDGPVGDVATEWHFVGANDTPVGSLKFVHFESPQGADPKPNKQVTDKDGFSKMWLVGSPKVPAVSTMKKPTEIKKQAKVIVGVTHKSAKDLAQNLIDFAGTGIGVWTGGPISLIGAAPEILYRLPWVAARTTVPVIDHEECDDRWFTLEYTATVKGNGRWKSADKGSEVTWSFNRLYEGNVGLYSRNVNLTPAEAMSLELTMAALKAERKFIYSNAKGMVHAEIDDRIATTSKEVCTDNTNETTSEISTWKANGDFPIFGVHTLITDAVLHTYNVFIPVGAKDEKAVRFSAQIVRSRSGGIAPSAGDGQVVKFFPLNVLPKVAGIIKNGIVIHDPEKDIPQSFPKEWEFDSGELMPDQPLISHIPETKTDVKIRIVYRFVFGCK